MKSISFSTFFHQLCPVAHIDIAHKSNCGFTSAFIGENASIWSFVRTTPIWNTICACQTLPPCPAHAFSRLKIKSAWSVNRKSNMIQPTHPCAKSIVKVTTISTNRLVTQGTWPAWITDTTVRGSITGSMLATNHGLTLIAEWTSPTFGTAGKALRCLGIEDL